MRKVSVGVAGIVAAVIVGALTAAPRTARAQSTGADADAYCEYVEGIAHSLSDVEMAPTIFGSGGLVSGAEAQPGTSIIGPTTRVIAGVNYSFSGLYRGLAMRSSAEADCKRYRSLSELHAFLVNNREGLTRASLAAKIAVLDEAMPQAEKMLADVKAALGQSRATVEQVDATQLRVDALRALASEAHGDLSRTAQSLPVVLSIVNPRDVRIGDLIRREPPGEKAARLRRPGEEGKLTRAVPGEGLPVTGH